MKKQTRPKFTVTIPADIIEKLKALAAKEKRSLSSMAEVVIAAGLECRKEKTA